MMKMFRAPVWISCLLITAVLACSFLWHLGDIPVRIWDEARNANNALHMYDSGQWLITYYDDQPDLWNTKPPLLIWIQVLLMKTVGVNEWALRLPAALSATATGWLLWYFCKKHFQNLWMGCMAAVILATSFAYVYNHAGRTGDYDAPMVLCITAYVLAAYRYSIQESSRYNWFFWIFLTIATWMKGVAGLLVLPGIAIYFLITGMAWNWLRKPYFYFGLAVWLLVIGGYYFFREQAQPGYLRAVYENELGGRFLKALEEHAHPFDFYWTTMKNWLYSYWFWFVLPAFILTFWYPATQKRFAIFNFIVCLCFFLLISSAQTKLEWYALPLYPLFALQIAILLHWLNTILHARFSVFSPMAGALVFLLIAVFPFYRIYQHLNHFEESPWDVEPHQPGAYIKAATQEGRSLDGYVILYEGYNGQIQFYTRQHAYKGENMRIVASVDDISAGQRIIVNQEKLKQEVLTRYRVQLLDEKSGCSVYLVQARL